MDTLEALHSRRSIRRYTDQPVPDELVEQIIAAGMMAPSANNQQPWHFVVIRQPPTLQAISEQHPHARMARHCQVALLVCGDVSRYTNGEMWVQDCSAAAENMLLAAHALGLGAVWVGVYPREERMSVLRTLTALPDHIVPLVLLPMGYPAEKRTVPERFDRARIHLERW